MTSAIAFVLIATQVWPQVTPEAWIGHCVAELRSPTALANQRKLGINLWNSYTDDMAWCTRMYHTFHPEDVK